MSLLLPWWWRWAALGAALVAAAAFGAVKMHEHDEARYDALQAQFQAFKDRTAALGAKAKKDAQDREARDRKIKEDSDAQNEAALAGLNRTIGELRKRAGSRTVPAAPASSPRPDLAAFDRAELERALGRYRESVRGLVDEGSADAVNLDSARRWAQQGH